MAGLRIEKKHKKTLLLVKKNMNINFNNKKVLIVGGAGTIGQQITKDFASLGAKILVLDSKVLKLKKKNIKSLKFEIKKVDQLNYNLKKKLKSFGSPSIFVNCSYPKTVGWLRNSFANINSSEISKNVELHQNSYMMLSIIVANIMVKQKINGSIINLSSIYGLRAQNLSVYKNTKLNENAIYVTMKHGINGLTKSMASYYGKYNIRVNSLCPGGVFNKVTKNSKNQRFFKNYFKRVAIKRMCSSKDVSNAALFLSSDYSNYITGINLPIDGGYTSM